MSPLDQPVGLALVGVCVVVVAIIMVLAWRDAHRERVQLRDSKRAGRAAIAVADELSAGAAPGLRCGVAGCVGVGEHYVTDRWVCTDCMTYLDSLDPRREYPFDQDAAAGVADAEEWANRSGEAS